MATVATFAAAPLVLPEAGEAIGHLRAPRPTNGT